MIKYGWIHPDLMPTLDADETINLEEVYEMFKKGDQVRCKYVGLEATSTHLAVGDNGVVHNLKLNDCDPTEYLVDFNTSDGWKRQWVYAHSIEKRKSYLDSVKAELLDRIKELQKAIDELPA